MVVGSVVPFIVIIPLMLLIDQRLEQAELRLEREAKNVQLLIDERDQMLRGELVRGFDRIEQRLK